MMRALLVSVALAASVHAQLPIPGGISGGGGSGGGGVVQAVTSTTNRYTLTSSNATVGAGSWIVNAVTPTLIATTDLNDIAVNNGFTGSTTTFCVQIATAATPDTVNWGTAGSCTNGATGVSITGSAQTLSNGFNVTFTATTGHTANDKWVIVATVGSAVGGASLSPCPAAGGTVCQSQDITLFTASARTKLSSVTVKQSAAYGGITAQIATNGVTTTIGWAAGGLKSEYQAACDVGAAVSATQFCDVGGWDSPTFSSHPVTLTLISACGSGSCALTTLTTGSLDVWVKSEVLP